MFVHFCETFGQEKNQISFIFVIIFVFLLCFFGFL